MVNPFRQILSPVDFNEPSLAALDYARLLAQQNKGTVYLLHVIPVDETHLLSDTYRPREDLFRPDEPGKSKVEWAEQVAREQLQKIAQERLSGVQSKIQTQMSSDPAATILEVEKELGADVVVMATHGRTGVTHLVLGSVAEKVVRESSCPVLTIRGEQDS